MEQGGTLGVTAATLAGIEQRVAREIDEAALASRRQTTATPEDVLRGVYATAEWAEVTR